QNISIIGYPVTPTQAVTVDFSERGTVADAGVNPSDLTFTVNNINSGLLTIRVKDGASTVLDKTLTFRGTRPNPAPINGGDSTSGGSVSPGTKTAGVVAPAVPGQVTQNLLLNQNGQTLQPYDIQTGTDSPVNADLFIPQDTTVHTPSSGSSLSQGEITITPVSDRTNRLGDPIPANPRGFSVRDLAIECTPDGTTFSNAVTITFTLSQRQWDIMMKVARGNPANVAIDYYDTTKGGWITLPSLKVDPATRTISGKTTHFTVFQVFVTNETAPDSTSAQTYGSLIQETPTTVSAPTVLATQAAAKASPTTTPKSPFVPAIAVIAIVGLVGYFVVSRKQ
ncbi:hypothetical protein, partial [Methanoregula sp.]|uniref:hypothetical protein n=1 Tax=Methanoregula sp. TaxID=2052170 RepID=UPI00356741F0